MHLKFSLIYRVPPSLEIWKSLENQGSHPVLKARKRLDPNLFFKTWKSLEFLCPEKMLKTLMLETIDICSLAPLKMMSKTTGIILEQRKCPVYSLISLGTAVLSSHRIL
jgi:hypothetical protein